MRVCLQVCIITTHMHKMQYSHMPKEGARYPETGVTGTCVLLCGCEKPNPSHLQEQQVILMADAWIVFSGEEKAFSLWDWG